MSRLLGTISLIGAGAATAYLYHDVTRLYHEYPVRKSPQTYNQIALANTFTAGPLPFAQQIEVDEANYIVTRIRVPRWSVVAQRPLHSFIEAFYETWTLRLEGVVGNLAGLEGKPGGKGLAREETDFPPAFAGGLFPVVHRGPSSLIVAWRGHQPTPDQKASRLPLGGVQELSAVLIPPAADSASAGDDDDYILEIGYACAEACSAEMMDSTLFSFHIWYMRFLMDRARARLEKWVGEGR